MNKIAEFFSKWAFAIVLCLIAFALVCAGVCTIHTAIERPFVGIVGTIGVAIALACVSGWIIIEIKEG
jgi:hypothetical protein